MYLENLVFDAMEPGRLGTFWEAALGGELLTDSDDTYETRLLVPDGPALDLCFQRVPDRPREEVRLHLDLLGGVDQQAVVERLVGLGARHLDIGQVDVPWVVLADPEGNPFCVMEERATYAETGPIAAIPIDSSNPVVDAECWSWLTGWVGAPGVAPKTLRHVTSRGLLLGFCPEPVPHPPAKNRLHLDIRLEAGDDPDGVHHVAFGIVPAEFELAHAWLSARVPLLVGDGSQVIIGSPGWNSRSLYFLGPEDIILEFIARDADADAAPSNGESPRILSISEIGIGVPDVPTTVHRLATEMDLPPFFPQGEQFAPVGNHDGLLIVVHQERIWFPTQSLRAARGPLDVRIQVPVANTQMDVTPAISIATARSAQ